ncbi:MULTISPECIES: DNA repair protein RadA [Candidatus Ichthyocystis]|uniref:DNA repair protein RadA n=1 Tax=Candidatus Ichthyocystis hellenicum TaxID=1561003 RepID=A0A0S4M2Z1_9BURK|nr:MULTISPECIES: DNA repair protein RadA [Ichthyocystis]CUT17643.1 DNA repair protein RadA [Candidatus Ichthyocystis hellenicum]
MKKKKITYQCQNCAAIAHYWQGKCSSCGEWNSLVELITTIDGRLSTSNSAMQQKICRLSDVEIADVPRWLVGWDEFDRVLGGGIVPGGVVLIGGDPGIGKSTLLLQVLSYMVPDRPVLYVTGEESTDQVALRAKRLNLKSHDMDLLAETDLDVIISTVGYINPNPQIIVVDSIQTMFMNHISSVPGSVSQVRECAYHLVRYAKKNNVSVIMIGHVTKDGSIAGPRVLEHIVDTVLYFEGDNHSNFRLVRSFKNRFGPVNEIGVFAMTENGLKGVSNPSALFLSQRDDPVSGTSVMVMQEATRPLLVEIQALVNKSYGTAPKRLTLGVDNHRLSMLMAVLARHAGVFFAEQDVFVSAVGGVRVIEPAADLAILLSIFSSIRNHVLPPSLVVFGEVGLTGEVRAAPRGQDRLREAAKLGFKEAIIPHANAPKQNIQGLRVHPVCSVRQALSIVLP